MKEKISTATGPSGHLDQQLDHALASYSPAQPRPGLENRVHARLDAAAESQRNRSGIPWWRVWPAAAALAAVLLAAGAVWFHARPEASLLAAHQAVLSRPSNPPSDLPTSPAPVRASAAKPHTRAQTPRMNSVPTQQQLIAQLVANHPEVIACLAKPADQADSPHEIKPISDDPLAIEPIKIDPLDDNPADPGERF